MKVTSDDTRMLEIEFGVFVHVRGEPVFCQLEGDEGPAEFAGRRVMIFEVVK